MKLTIVVEDNLIAVNNISIRVSENSLSWIPEDVRAIQWNNNQGHIEYVDNSPNTIITELGIYEQAIQIFNAENERIEKEKEEYWANYDWMKDFREMRNRILLNCDWTQSIDAPISESKKIEWQLYRQQLRDLPQSITDAKSMVLDKNHSSWPIPPS